MSLLSYLLSTSATFLNVCGAVIVLFASIWALVRWAIEEARGTVSRTQIIEVIRQTYRRLLLLGLEFLIAGDIIRSVNSRQWSDLAMLGAFIILRLLLSASLQNDREESTQKPRKK